MYSESDAPKYAWIIFAIIVLTGMGTCSWYVWPRNVPAQVMGSNWTWTHHLRQKTKEHTEHWHRPYQKDVVPGTLKCESRFYEWDEICTGIDETKICVPIPDYEDWCAYDYWAWPIIKSASTTGDWTQQPCWPNLEAIGPDQRIDQVQLYEVLFQEDGEEKRKCIYNPGTLEELKTFHTETWWKIRTNAGFSTCKPLELLTAEEI